MHATTFSHDTCQSQHHTINDHAVSYTDCREMKERADPPLFLQRTDGSLYLVLKDRQRRWENLPYLCDSNMWKEAQVQCHIEPRNVQIDTLPQGGK